MYLELRSGDDVQPLLDAEADVELTMLVGRDESLREILQEIGMRVFRAAFLVLDSDAFAPGQEARWFGQDGNAGLAILKFSVPQRTACVRLPADADPFDIGQSVLHCEKANQ